MIVEISWGAVRSGYVCERYRIELDDIGIVIMYIWISGQRVKFDAKDANVYVNGNIIVQGGYLL